jgi:branched-chain amino acid transport system ATP-binding protein
VTAPALEVRGLSVLYGRVRALRDVSLRVDRGELVTVVGPNGAGKSTVLRAIAGEVPISAGTVAIDGTPVAGLAMEDIVRLGVAAVPEGRELFGPLTVRQNLALGAYARPRADRRAAMGAELDAVLDLFPVLRARLDQAAGTLSGGEQQMLAIGRALMARPRLLLLDEPSVGLAPLVVGLIFRAIERLKREGLTILLVEQNARAAFRIADRGYALGPGGVMRGASGAGAADEARQAYGLELTREESPT